VTTLWQCEKRIWSFFYRVQNDMVICDSLDTNHGIWNL